MKAREILSNNHTKTAILFFTRSAEEEACAKTYCNSCGFNQNKTIAKNLINHTYKQIRDSGLSYRVFTSNKQRGNTFGERLGNAFQSLFEQGYHNVIAVGNDCPELTARNLQYAASLFTDHSLVAGPAADGGIYLLGISKRAFNKKTFSNLSWETDRLLDDLGRYACENDYSLCPLCPAADIDNEKELRNFIKQSYGSELYYHLAILLLSILCGAVYVTHKHTAYNLHHSYLHFFHRGPPVQ